MPFSLPSDHKQAYNLSFYDEAQFLDFIWPDFKHNVCVSFFQACV